MLTPKEREALRAVDPYVTRRGIAEFERILTAREAAAAEQARAEVVAAVEAVDLSCELYDEPGQDCITAGPAVFDADGCTSCHVRAALATEPTP